jgi:hypothetical protein
MEVPMAHEPPHIRHYSPEAEELRAQLLGDLRQLDVIHQRRREPLLRALAVIEAAATPAYVLPATAALSGPAVPAG